MDTIRILLVEDDPTDAAFTRAMLGRVRDAVVDVRWVTTVEAGLDALADGSFDVVLVDYLLGSRTGLDLVRKAAARDVSTPMILLTGKGSRDLDVEALEAGVDDYLVKGRIDPIGLERALRYTLERARARQDLLESEARFRGLFDHLPLGLFRCTPDGGFLDANPALRILLGDPSPDLMRNRYAAHLYVHPSDSPDLRQALEQDGIVRAFESWLERGDGTRLPVRTTARAHRDGAGDIAYVEGVVEDVRDLRSMERILQGPARFRALVDHLPLPVAVVDREGRLVEVSPSFAARFDGAVADLVREPFHTVVDPEAAEAWRSALEGLAAGHEGAVAVRLRTPSGAVLPATCVPVHDETGAARELLVHIGEVEGP